MILGFDTATPATAVAVLPEAGEPVELRHEPAPGERPGHAAQLLPLARRALEALGATFADVCKVTVFLKNIADREKVNTVRREYFGAHRPASTLVEISRLVRDEYLIEIEAIAVVPPR